MNTCDTCKHWTGCDLRDQKFKICQLLDADRRNGSCEAGVIFAGSSDDDRNTIHTGPKFGCIHWEKKP